MGVLEFDIRSKNMGGPGFQSGDPAA